MSKIFKQQSLNISGEPVPIDNAIAVPEPETPESEPIEDDGGAEEKIRFDKAVRAETEKLISGYRARLETERVEVLRKAQSECDMLRRDADAAVKAAFEKATKDGEEIKESARKSGYAAGKEEALTKCRRFVDAAAKLLSDINVKKDAYFLSNEEELRETVFVIAEKIVRTEIKTNPKAIASIIEDAAKNFRNSDYVKISLADGEITETFKSDRKLINKIMPFISDIELEFLSEADEGTVIIDDDSEIVDASVPTQLDFLKEILKNTRGEDE